MSSILLRSEGVVASLGRIASSSGERVLADEQVPLPERRRAFGKQRRAHGGSPAGEPWGPELAALLPGPGRWRDVDLARQIDGSGRQVRIGYLSFLEPTSQKRGLLGKHLRERT